jgi:hypothetical protein
MLHARLRERELDVRSRNAQTSHPCTTMQQWCRHEGTKCKQTTIGHCERPNMAPPPRSTRLHFLDAYFWLPQPSAPWKQGSVQRREHSLLPAMQGEIHPKTQTGQTPPPFRFDTAQRRCCVQQAACPFALHMLVVVAHTHDGEQSRGRKARGCSLGWSTGCGVTVGRSNKVGLRQEHPPRACRTP